jgi:hypothetical protein
MRRRIVAIACCVGALAIPATALAGTDFGPGGSSKGPHDPGALCHPPGQTADFPACK